MTAATFVQEGSSIDYTPGSAVAAGDVVVQGDLVGVAKRPIAANAPGSLAVEGVFDFPKATGGGSALSTGVEVFWNAGDKQATATAAGNKRLGTVVAAAADADATVRVRLAGGGDQEPATPTKYGLVKQSAADADITDSTGGTAGNGLAAMTNTTALTDNGGGTADGTVAAMTAAAAITDSSGGVDPGDNTIAAITNANNAGSADVVPTAAAVAQLAAKLNTTGTAIGAVKDNVKELTTQLALQRTLNGKLVDAVAALAAEINDLRSKLRTAGILASS